MKMYVGYPKKKSTRIARIHGNVMKRTSEPHESAINYKKRTHCYIFWENHWKVFSFCWRSKAIVEPKSESQKIYFCGGVTHKRAYFHAFQTNGQIAYTCVEPQKLRWPRAPRFLNPFLRSRRRQNLVPIVSRDNWKRREQIIQTD